MKYERITKPLDSKCFEFVEVHFFLRATDTQYVGRLASESNDGGRGRHN